MRTPVSVLIAEDDRDQREILTEVFECEGYRVITAASPAQTLEKLATGPDVVLLDLHGASSPEVERALGAAAAPRPIIIVISGDNRATNLARNVCASEFIEKPYDLEKLLGTVQDLTDGRPRDSVLSGPATRG